MKKYIRKKNLIKKFFRRDNIMEKTDGDKINEIITELSECREDSRSSENLIIQIIATAGTILGLIFSASALLENGNKESTTSEQVYQVQQVFLEESECEIEPAVKKLQIGLLILNNLIFCTAFGYIVSLGLTNVLRYHYIRSLEDILYQIIPKTDSTRKFINWFSFSSPITTRNLLHIKSPYTWIHYISYGGAVITAIAFCLIITFLQYEVVKDYSKYTIWAWITPCIFMGISCIGFFFLCIKSDRMYKYALEKSLQNRNKRLGEQKQMQEKQEKEISSTVKFWLKMILYLIYPKKKDFQKIFLLIAGACSGLFLQNGKLTIEILKKHSLDIGIALLVIEFLLYSARYQWNDIRGLVGDLKFRKKDKLPIGYKGEDYSSKITSFTLVVKVLCAFWIISKLERKLQLSLGICSLVIIIITILYELARTKKWNRAIFFLVSLGYPVRFFAGMGVVCPESWNSDITIMNSPIYGTILMILLGCSIACYGEFSVVYPWLHEMIQRKKALKSINAKSYFEFLWDRVSERVLNFQIDSVIKEKGKWSDFWNVVYLGSMIFLSSMIGFIFFDIRYFIVEVITLILAFLLCYKFYKNLIWLGIEIIVFIILKLVLYFLFGCHIWWVFIFILQIVYTISYVFMRYFFTPDWDFSKSMQVIYVLIIGKETYEYIEKNKFKNK